MSRFSGVTAPCQAPSTPTAPGSRVRRPQRTRRGAERGARNLRGLRNERRNRPVFDHTCRECRATRCGCCGDLITYDSFQLRIVDPTLCCDALLDDVRLRLEAAKCIIDAGWPYLATPEGLSFTPP